MMLYYLTHSDKPDIKCRLRQKLSAKNNNMKKKAKQQIMQKKAKELETLIEKKREEVARMQLKTSEEKNKNIVRNLKHEIALMLTVLREQQILEEAAGGGTHE